MAIPVYSIAQVAAMQSRLASGDWRKDVQCGNWAGRPVAEILGLNADAKEDRAKVKAVIDRLLVAGHLRVFEKLDERRRPKKFIEAGPPVEAEAEDEGSPILDFTPVPRGAEFESDLGED